jgi:heat shock protein HslJ
VAPASGLAGRTFVSTSVTEGGKPRTLVDGSRIALTFDREGRLLANAGCNIISGPVRLDGGQLKAPDLSTTEIACDPELQQQDTWLAGVLKAGPSWRLDGSNLTLTTGETTLALTDREVVQPNMGLKGPRWTLDTLVDGETASSVAAGVEASLVFGEDHVDVHAGCNQGSATYRVDGDSIIFGPLVLTRMACPEDVMAVERAVVDVLQGEVTYMIDADRLTLKGPSGKALQLRGIV